MARLLALVSTLLIAAASAAQPVAVDSVARRPAFGVPLTGDFEPPQTSAALAYLYSAAATAIPLAAGAVLLQISEPSGTAGQVSPGDIGMYLVIAGVWAGPAAGNLSLGAGGDVRRGAVYTVGGFLSGVVLAGGAVLIGGVCLAGDLAQGQIGSGDCAAGPLVAVLLVSAAALTAAGTLAGAGHHLATIPRNAALAQRYRQSHPRVALAPGWRSGGPALSLRVGL